MQTTLRTVGGSIAMTIPKSIVDELGLKADAKVDLVVLDGQLIVKTTRRRPKYKLADLLAQCDPTAELTPAELEWLNAPSVGREIIE
jgi:antitoxin ChpS